MKKTLLTTVAAAALAFGMVAAQAQSDRGMQGGQSGATQGGMSGSAPGSRSKEAPGARSGESTGSRSSQAPGSRSESAPGQRDRTTGQSDRMKSDDMKSDRMKSKSGTTGQSDRMKSEDTKSDRMKSKSGTTGQSKSDRENMRGEERQQRMRSEKNQDRMQSGDMKQGSKAGTSGQGSAGGASASLSQEQRTRVEQRFKSVNLGRARVNRERVTFNIAVGTIIPQTVTYYDLPATIVEVVPAWRRYKYIVVEDEILIIDPATRRIVAVMPV